MVDTVILVLLLLNAVVTTGLIINAQALAAAMGALLQALEAENGPRHD